MNRVKNPLFQCSLAIALLSRALARVLLQSESPLAAMSLGVQSLAALLLSLLPLTGIVLGVLSWKRAEITAYRSVIRAIMQPKGDVSRG